MLINDNLSLRAPEPDDIDFILDMENDTSLWHVSNTHNPFSRFDIEQYIMMADKDIYSAQQLRLIIIKSDELTQLKVGIVDIFDCDFHNRRAGVGILIIEKEQNNGYAGLALDMVVDFMFRNINIHQLYCNIATDNAKSKHLFQSRGFVHVGVKKDWNIINNKWVDESLYQLVNANSI